MGTRAACCGLALPAAQLCDSLLWLGHLRDGVIGSAKWQTTWGRTVGLEIPFRS
jgi:hypothetical protein